MFLGENLPLWLLLAFGAALAAGNAMALLRPAPPPGRGSRDAAGPDSASEQLQRPPVVRSLIMIAIGGVAAIWALASLISG